MHSAQRLGGLLHSQCPEGINRSSPARRNNGGEHRRSCQHGNRNAEHQRVITPHSKKLVCNCVPYTKDDRNSDQKPGVAIDFEDEGPGVPRDLREQIFNPFFTTKRDGVGLGLSIVSKIIDEHGGSIRLVDKAGPGACFRVFLPS